MRRLFAAIGSAIALFIAIALVAPPPSPAAALNDGSYNLTAMTAPNIIGTPAGNSTSSTGFDDGIVIANTKISNTTAVFYNICAIDIDGASTQFGRIDTSYGGIPAVAVALTDWKPVYDGTTLTGYSGSDADGPLASTDGPSPTTPAHLRC